MLPSDKLGPIGTVNNRANPSSINEWSEWSDMITVSVKEPSERSNYIVTTIRAGEYPPGTGWKWGLGLSRYGIIRNITTGWILTHQHKSIIV